MEVQHLKRSAFFRGSALILKLFSA